MTTRPEKMDDVKNWTDSQIIEYLKEYWESPYLVFDAYADEKPLRTKNPQNFQGSINQLKSKGKSIKYPILESPIFFNILNNVKIDFTYGQCVIKCSLADREFREQIGNMFYLNPILSTFRITGEIIPKIADDSDIATLKRNWKIKDEKFIGLFSLNSNRSYTISDIRRSDFSLLILPNGKKQSEFSFSPNGNFKLSDNTYYEFGWLLKQIKPNYEYLFEVNEMANISIVTSQSLVERLHDDIFAYPAGAGQKIVKMLETLKNQLTASGKEIFIYELLQNANDYPKGKDKMVDVEFYITKDFLIFQHTGSKFNEKNIAAICNINAKEKTDNIDTIGYKGIGFKTVFLDNNYVYLKTGGFSFRFDQSYTKDMVDTPYQILPIWTDFEKINPEIKNIFKKSSRDYHVQFALRPISHATLRHSNQNFVNLFSAVFENERVILFIPHISSVKVYHSNSETPDIIRTKDAESWQVNTYVEEVSEELRDSINSEIDKQEEDGTFKIPTKYYNFQKTAISFACQRENSILGKVEDANLYCYLPTKATWGFDFLMNTDMIPTGPRDDIEMDININAEIAEISGRKFFLWIKDLLMSPAIKTNTIFTLIPNFDKCKREHKKYEMLINQFQKGFDDCLRNEPIIPIEKGYAKIKDVIFDETRITASSVMSDAEYLNFAGIEDKYLPLVLLRKDNDFNSFLKRYIKSFEYEGNIFETENLVEFCSNDEFNVWLQNQDCNNRFLKFLIDKQKLDDFINESIFLSSKNELYKASEIYNDIDLELVDLSAFGSYLPHLSLETRKYFNEFKELEKSTDDIFKAFDADKFVDDILLCDENKDDVVDILQNKDNSYHFYKFLAERVGFSEKYKNLPFIDAEGNVVDNFENCLVYFNSKEGYGVKRSLWMNEDWINFISDQYCNSAREYFSENFDVEEFSHKSIIGNIITNEDYDFTIKEKIQNDFVINHDFVFYCFNQQDIIGSGALKNYALNANDKNGDSDYRLTEENIYFESNFYENYSTKAWINSEWMFSLDNEYFKGIVSSSEKEFKKFLSDKFYVKILDDVNFYNDVIRQNLETIFKAISGDGDPDGSSNIDFVQYLDLNYKLIFEDERDEDKFSTIVLVDSNEIDLQIDETSHLYLFDSELEDIINNNWFTCDLVYLCSSRYNNSKSLQKIGIKKYSFSAFFDSVIVGEINAIKKNLYAFENNKGFHSFIVNHINSLTTDQILNIKQIPVFLYGSDNPVETSCNHKILSSKAKELFEKGLVAPKDLDIINPEYFPEQCAEYWETKLGNSKFTVSHFMDWLAKNEDIFVTTIEPEKANIDYWRWVKDNVTETSLKVLPKLPVLIKDSANTVKLSNTIYFSNKYLDGAGIESIVTKYDKDALFISDVYILVGDSISQWKTFWMALGVHSDIIDILINSVIPNLSTIEDENLPALLANYSNELSKTFNNLPATLSSMRVKAHDEKFYNLAETIYIDCEKKEPFNYLSMPNVIVFATASERSLMLDIIKSTSATFVSTLTDWQKLKVSYYIKLQNENEKKILNFHFNFISELSSLYNDDRDSLKGMELLNDIKLLSKDDIFENASDLTLGTKYKPFCDFQICGITNLLYISDDYITNCDVFVNRFFNRILRVHCDFKESDVQYLNSREFSIYFWRDYLVKKDADIPVVKKLIAEGIFNDCVCIPTSDFVKKPTEIYSRSISVYVENKIEDWDNKFAIRTLPEIELENKDTLFDLLPFKESLDFYDCLYAFFSIKGQDRRSQILSWMVDAYDESYDNKIQEYREETGALWYNAKNEEKQISELYALEYGNKALFQYFGSNPRIINSQYFPSGSRYEKACEILKIDIIKSDDLLIEPINQKNQNDSIKPFLNLCSLIIAGIESNEDWETRYDGYLKKISGMSLWNCDSISFHYIKDRDINQALKKFYHASNDDENFYFVNSWSNNRVFTSFVDEFIKYIGATMEKDLVEDILSDKGNAIEIIKEQNHLLIDENFIAFLESYVPGISQKVTGNLAQEDEDVFGYYPESFKTKPYSDSESEDESNEKDEVEYTITDDNSSLDITNTLPKENSVSQDIFPKAPDFEDEVKCNDDEVEDDEEVLINGERPNKPRPKFQFPHRTEPPHNDDFSEEGNISHSFGNSEKSYTARSFNPSAPQPRTGAITEWKKIREQAKLNVADATQEELAAARELIDGTKTNDEIIDEHYLARFRLYNALTQKGYSPEDSLKEFVNSRNNDITTNKGYIYTRSAKGGILFISSILWHKILYQEGRLCMYYGNKACDFEIINNIDHLIEYVGDDNIIIQIKGDDKKKTINSVFDGFITNTSAHVLIRIKSNERYNSLFAPIYSTNDDNDASI